MKLQHVALLIIALMGSSAFASKARLQALGQDENGSYYIQDTRNIFLNPAAIMETANFANFEWGETTRPNQTPNAEGGFIQSHENLKYGIQLGRETQLEENVLIANALANGATPAGFAAAEDTLELLIGGGAEMKWGGSFIYQRSKDDNAAFPKTEASGYELKGGVAQDAWNAYGRLNLLNNSTREIAAGSEQELKGTFGLLFGGAYELSQDQTVYAELGWEKFDVESTPQAFNYDVEGTAFNVGYAKMLPKDATTMFFYSVAFAWEKAEAKDSVSATKAKSESLYFPVTLGVEAEANSWMTLRGSVSQNVLISQIKEGDDKSENSPNSTVVAAGAGFKFKSLILDATFQGATSGNGQINAVNFLSNVGMTYLF